MNLTLETGPTATAGWLAYCAWARDILRESPVESVLEYQDQAKRKLVEKRYSARRD